MARPKKIKTTTIFATNLKKVLEDRQLTLKMAAELMGIAYTTLVDWANGSSPSDIEAIGGFCRKLGIDFAWLMLGQRSESNLSEVPLESLFEEQDAGFDGLYRLRATKLVRKKVSREEDKK